MWNNKTIFGVYAAVLGLTIVLWNNDPTLNYTGMLMGLLFTTSIILTFMGK